jgi:YfiH family protein
MRDNGFLLVESAGLSYYTCAALTAIPGLRHGFSTRTGGVSPEPAGSPSLNLGNAAWDSPANVRENRRRFLSALRLRPKSLATVCQVHSADFHIIKGGVDQWNPRTRGDALATAEAGVSPAVQVADCFPVLLADPGTGAIAAVHAGWRGTLERILARTLAGMRRELRVDPARVLIAVGPGIRSCCLEVGPEVADAFNTAYPGAQLCAPRPGHPGKHLLDLPAALELQWREEGVSPENVFDLGLCTRCRPQEFFSYRAEGPRAGRMMAVIGKENG